jgi:hypothetical protein
MPINLVEIVEKEGRAMQFGMTPPYTHYASQAEVDGLLSQYDGMPIKAKMLEQISTLGGILFSNTIIKPKASSADSQ